MSINPNNRWHRQIGASLSELLVVVGVFGIIGAIIAAFYYYGAIQTAITASYADMSADNQKASNYLSKDGRGIQSILSYTTNTIQFKDQDNITVYYAYDPNQQTLSRYAQGVYEVLLEGVDECQIDLTKPVANGSFEAMTSAGASDAQMMQVTWRCSREVMGNKLTTDKFSTASFVLRRKR